MTWVQSTQVGMRLIVTRKTTTIKFQPVLTRQVSFPSRLQMIKCLLEAAKFDEPTFVRAILAPKFGQKKSPSFDGQTLVRRRSR